VPYSILKEIRCFLIIGNKILSVVRIFTRAGFEPSTVFALLKGLGPKYEEVRLLSQSVTVIQSARDFF
jgi:hypothetical protein